MVPGHHDLRPEPHARAEVLPGRWTAGGGVLSETAGTTDRVTAVTAGSPRVTGALTSTLGLAFGGKDPSLDEMAELQ
ncbi:hypothetical protein EBO15_43230 [Actinomadura harenae]|uniref:Uncharacterized protein n=1 Tax=Actinomadura harenae TaxID=2483351 RepID=A0A3M2L1C0_9ACTN|nr:hypothetical protein EBO15_43230 [Actinomadura harenae]